jgi:hypothetical protein
MPCNCQPTSRPVTPPAAGTAKTSPPLPGPSVRYSGPTSTTAVGAVSGRRYTFGHTGAVVRIDPRDKVALTKVPHLRQI